MKLGVDVLLEEDRWRRRLDGRRVALLGHPASVTGSFTHTMDALIDSGIGLIAGFSPQHGMQGDKQDNMVESEDYFDPHHKIPVFSLYGQTLRPTAEMLSSIDVVLVDLQEIGCRVYTYATTLLYMLEECAARRKTVFILDRPNPIGRRIEGSLLEKEWSSLVGASPTPMRHGLTIAELAGFFIDHYALDVECEIIKMENYDPVAAPGYGWPVGELPWINPSPNAPCLTMARSFPGLVLLEGTHLSEGRGTTRPLEVGGAPDLDPRRILEHMESRAPDWLLGCSIRACYFEPTFHKHNGALCRGIHVCADGPLYDYHSFRPYRLGALFLKSIRQLCGSEYALWRDFTYEYEEGRKAIDVINGGPLLRTWVDDAEATPSDLDRALLVDEAAWAETRAPFLIYGYS